MSEILQRIKHQLNESSDIIRLLAETSSDQIAEVAALMADCMRSGGKVLLFGNGGSASDAQHLAGELVGRFRMERNAFPAISLATNTSIITAVANDYEYNMIFARQVEALGRKTDVIVGISTSGNSPNVVEGIKKAKQIGAKTVGLTGGNGGKIAELADMALIVPSSDTPRIQEAHIVIGHIICDVVEKLMTSNK